MACSLKSHAMVEGKQLYIGAEVLALGLGAHLAGVGEGGWVGEGRDGGEADEEMERDKEREGEGM